MSSRKKRTNPYHISRYPADFNTTEIHEYAYFAGVVMWSWNELQSEYQHLFACIVDRSKLEIGISAWNSISSDQAQREMLDAMLREYLHPRSQRREKTNLLWAIKNTKLLAPYRNYAAHLPIEVEIVIRRNKHINEIRPHRAARTGPAKIVSAIGYKRLYRLMIGDLLSLRDYVSAHCNELFGRVCTGTLPYRPRLQVHRTVQEKLRPPAKSKASKQKPPPRSSRA